METEELAKQGGSGEGKTGASHVLTALWMPGSRPQHIGGREKAELEGAALPEEVRSSRLTPQILPLALPSRAGSSGWRQCL